jgi:ketosteroid isomerase-like protein
MRVTGWLRDCVCAIFVRPIFVCSIFVYSIFVCAGLTGVQAQGDGKGNVATAILALEQAWSDAESRNDNRALDEIFDNALVYVEDGRLATKGEYLGRVRLAGLHPRQIVAAATTVRIFSSTAGSTAIVVGIYRETGMKDGKVWLRQWRFIDTWVNKQGRWLLVGAGASPLSK